MQRNPFHPGELEAQRQAKAGDVASWAGGFIRDRMPDQHREFFSALPFLVVAGGDRLGRTWVTIVEGPDRFVGSPDPRSLVIAAKLSDQDPLAEALVPGAAVGVLGIETATRRRNRVNGLIRASQTGFAIEVQQSFGNCPQYIREREWHRVSGNAAAVARVSSGLDADQRALITAADTLFVGSGSHGLGGARSFDGYDASHRGGPPGFVKIAEDGTLHIPDFAGNQFFNTIGNLLREPSMGIVIVEFTTGRLLHITGRARIDWAPEGRNDVNALRMIEVTVDEVVDRPAALALRWRARSSLRRLKVVAKVKENYRITSFFLVPDNGAALEPFVPGQHLPIELDIPGQLGRIMRSYSLSGVPGAATYRISVKLENSGIASTFLHSEVGVGSTIEARAPSGDFVIPGGIDPLVLVSVGVGITPMLSLMHAAVAVEPGRQVWFIHGAHDGRNHAFRAEVEAFSAAHPNIKQRIFYSKPTAMDELGPQFDAKGRITAADLLALKAGAKAHFMLCGPAQFLAEVRTGLERLGVLEGQIHCETFGPTK